MQTSCGALSRTVLISVPPQNPIALSMLSMHTEARGFEGENNMGKLTMQLDPWRNGFDCDSPRERLPAKS